MVDCFKERSAQSATMKSNSLLTLHCVDLCTDVSLILQELPVLEWLAVLGHVSPLHRLTERRYVLLPKLRTAIHPLQGVRSPILIDVKNSFDLELEDHEPILVIWKFEEVPGVVQHALKPLRHYEGTNDTPTMPWLELQNCSCNCTKWPRTDLVLVNNENEEEEKEELTESDGGHSDSEESSDDNITDADLDHHVQRSNMETVSDATDALPATESFKLKGCSFHPSMQHALRQAQRLIAANKEVLVTIFEHSANVRDDNALMAKILINNMYEPVGYIPGRKVKKVKASLDNKELTSVLLKRVHRQYIPALNDFMLFGYIHITKRGPWLPDNKSYKYNS